MTSMLPGRLPQRILATRGAPLLTALVLVVAIAPIASAAQAEGGTIRAWAKEEPALLPGRGTSVDATAADITVPPDSLLGTSTWIDLRADARGFAWISDECNAGQYLCHAHVFFELQVPSKDVSDITFGACSTGSGCPAHPTGIGRAMSAVDPRVGFFISHQVLGLGSQLVSFQICGYARIYLDLDGDGQWSDDPPWQQASQCDWGTVRVGPPV